MNSSIKPTALALALGLALAGVAIAQSAPTPAQQQELDAARAALDQAAQRYGELARKYGEAGAPIRIEKRMLRKPVIGVLLAPDEASGVRIAGITPDSAAAAGGLKSGDRIVAIDDKPIDAASGVERVDQTRRLLAATDAKTPVKLGFERDGKTRVVTLTPKVGDRLLFLPGAEGGMFDDGDVQVIEVQARQAAADARVAERHARIAEVHARAAEGDAKRHAEWAAIAPGVRREVIRLGSDCKGDDCKLPMLAEAFRWNGLNLATVDAELGRYFGASDGVLVLSAGKDLAGLEAGDVIRRIDGKPVDNPREAMAALRAQPADSKVSIDYLRDRKPGTAQVSVPKALPFRIPMPPPAPPAPPAPPTAMHAPHPPLPPMAPPAPGAPHAVHKRIEKRVQVIVDENGKRTVIEGDDLPPPPPPPPPAPPAPPKVN